ncbi:Uncharacterised protein [Halioglobus japonicus]|nr:Uncharacterised protein [Halioglobus japonicus]
MEADEHISYAMRNTEALERFISFNAPSELLDWSFLAIEFILLVGVVCAVLHAWRYYRRTGHLCGVFTLLGALIFGLLNDIVSYYTVESFWHGEFSVMLVFNRMPLYISVLLSTLLYHTCMTIRRYEFSRGIEALTVGFYTAVMYMIFDHLGPMLNWWIWDRGDPSNLPFLNAVPITSHFWLFAWTAIFAFFNRIVCWDWVEQGRSRGQIWAGVALFPLLTCIVGIAVFIPLNVLAEHGLYAWIATAYAVTFGLAGMIFVLQFKWPTMPRDRLLMIFPLVWAAGHLFIYIAKFDLYYSVNADGLSTEGLAVGNLIVAVVAIIAFTAITLVSHPVDVIVQSKEERR